jgi:hypothetical protein
MACDHQEGHSGGARLAPESGELRLIRICDRCGSELEELGRIPYSPAPRLLAIHLTELTARELHLPEGRIAALRLAALTGETPPAGSTEAQVIDICVAYTKRLGSASARAGSRVCGGRPHGRRASGVRVEAVVARAFARALREHDARLDRAAA